MTYDQAMALIGLGAIVSVLTLVLTVAWTPPNRLTKADYE
jgi:hypothetical protein